MGEIRWVEDTGVNSHYTVVDLEGRRYFLERKEQPKILRKLSFDKDTGVFRVELIDDPALRNRIMHLNRQ